ncbi:MAG: DEAD/DEAH box helicase [bacterium]
MAALPLMFRQRSLLVVAPTGSGKTLAYALPLLTIIKVRAGKGILGGLILSWDYMKRLQR